MLQLNYIRQHLELVKQKLAIRNFKESGLVEEIIKLDDERRKLQLESEQTQSKLNIAAKEIGQLMGKGSKDEAEAKKAEVTTLKSALQPILEQLTIIENQLQDILVKLPNLPADKVPPGVSPEDNVVIREGGKKPVLPASAVPHWELIKKYDIVDFETGAKITGSGFPLYKGKGAKLQRGLIQYFLDYNVAAGYTEYLPPFMVNEASAYGTGQLPDKEGQMYHATEDNLYLIPTAEVPITNIYRDK